MTKEIKLDERGSLETPLSNFTYYKEGKGIIFLSICKGARANISTDSIIDEVPRGVDISRIIRNIIIR